MGWCPGRPLVSYMTGAWEILQSHGLAELSRGHGAELQEIAGQRLLVVVSGLKGYLMEVKSSSSDARLTRMKFR